MDTSLRRMCRLKSGTQYFENDNYSEFRLRRKPSSFREINIHNSDDTVLLLMFLFLLANGFGTNVIIVYIKQSGCDVTR